MQRCSELRFIVAVTNWTRRRRCYESTWINIPPRVISRKLKTCSLRWKRSRVHDRTPLLGQGVSRAVLLASAKNTQETARTKTKDLQAQFLERGGRANKKGPLPLKARPG